MQGAFTVYRCGCSIALYAQGEGSSRMRLGLDIESIRFGSFELAR
jgi:hypothetical protein